MRGRAAQQDARQDDIGSDHPYGGEGRVGGRLGAVPLRDRACEPELVSAPQSGDQFRHEALHRAREAGRSA